MKNTSMLLNLESTLTSILGSTMLSEGFLPSFVNYSGAKKALILTFGFPITYSNNSIHENGLRLLVVLEEKHQLFRFLRNNDVSKILVTKVNRPQDSNSSNTIQFDTSAIEEMIKQLVELKRTSNSIYESALEIAVINR